MNFSFRAHNLFDTPRFVRGVRSRDTSVGAAVRAAMPMVAKRANAKPTSAKRNSAKRMGVRAAATVAAAA